MNERERERERERDLQLFTILVGHLRGMELLRQHYEEASSKASQLRTPLYLVHQKSTINSTPTSSSNIAISNRTCQNGSRQRSAHRSPPNTFIRPKQPAVPDGQGDGKNTLVSSTGCGKETCSEQHNGPSKICRKLATNSDHAAASITSHLRKHQHLKQITCQLPQQRPTNNNTTVTGNSTTPLTATVQTVTTTTEVMEMDLTKEDSTRFTPVPISNGSMTKRRLKLEEVMLCRPQTKRRRTVDSSGNGKKYIAKAQQREIMGQRKMQSYFKPV